MVAETNRTVQTVTRSQVQSRQKGGRQCKPDNPPTRSDFEGPRRSRPPANKVWRRSDRSGKQDRADESTAQRSLGILGQAAASCFKGNWAWHSQTKTICSPSSTG